jgi:hypothetical protein
MPKGFSPFPATPTGHFNRNNDHPFSSGLPANRPLPDWFSDIYIIIARKYTENKKGVRLMTT